MWKSNPYNYNRRPTDEINIGTLKMGGDNLIRIQSMANTSTNDIESSVAQCIRIVDAGADLVRFTTQGIKEVESLRVIREKLREQGYQLPLVADVHFNANVADYAAQFVDKVRINPGNYVSGIKTDTSDGYTDEEYLLEFKKNEARLVEFLKICKEQNRAIRIGVNHGSLSERMLMKWGNTPEGMVESCMEFLRVCRAQAFSNLVISMKASNTVMMIQAVRLLVERMESENFHFPIHLGVTEAGDGEDGRVKSAVGIGALLAEGIGNTIRVSLSEEPEAEIPVARLLRDYITARAENPTDICPKSPRPVNIKPFTRRETTAVSSIGNNNLPIVISAANAHSTLREDYILQDDQLISPEKEIFPIYSLETYAPSPSGKPVFLRTSFVELSEKVLALFKQDPSIILLLEAGEKNPVGEYRAFIHTLIAEDIKNPVIVVGRYKEDNLEALQIKASADLGIVFVDGLADGILIQNEGTVSQEDILSLSFGILQAARVRVSKTEYISCPGCGRTMFNLQTVIARIKEKTAHLTGLKVGIMGCIVNGPGEMADADYGYVGAGRGKVSLYKKHECIEKNVSEEEAVDKLIDLIKKNGDWVDAAN